MLPPESGFFEQCEKRPGAAVHDRHFWPVKVDTGLVDTMAVEGGEKVFDGGNTQPAFTEGGGQAGVDHPAHVCRNRGTARDISTVKGDAAVRRLRGNGEMDRSAGVQADAVASDPAGQGVLERMRGVRHVFSL